jgi:hypothetical protein
LTEPVVTRKDLRTFGCIVAAGFTIVGAISYYRHRLEPSQTFAVACWGIASGLALLALAAPALLRPFFRFWVALGHVLGYINTRIILGLTFFGLFTTFGLMSRRVFRRDPLQLARARRSYWMPPHSRERDHRRLF